ncbi:rap guanine nucleotide exchange factor 6-like [Ptychodera flava]|uniref:rap guanine nucleotide exchange factor 6-like n=1 Tax=Ptychodera flava TaxID=63121 RepID=UPI00396A81BD
MSEIMKKFIMSLAAYPDRQFIILLQKRPEERTPQDLQYIYSQLHGMEALNSLREPALRAICKSIRYEFHDANDILYCRDDLSSSWFILLTGSVFIDGSMYLPRSSFGKRTSGSGRRGSECLILEPSEMLVIDYPDVQLMRPGQRQSCTTMNLEKLLALEQEEVKIARTQSLGDDEQRRPVIRLERTQSLGDEKILSPYRRRANKLKLVPLELQNVQSLIKRAEQEHGLHIRVPSAASISDKSSRPSSDSSSYSDLFQPIDSIDVDLTGLVESTVDSDEEDQDQESSESLSVRDIVRDCLEKDPVDRTEDDIEILLDFIRHLPAFANMTLAVRRALCAVMVFAVVEKAGTVVMKDNEELDSWSVILNGHVEVVRPDSTIEHLHLGDSFGCAPSLTKQTHRGTMKTKVDDCQFVCIAQSDYYKILHQGEENTRKIKEEGEVVLITEHRVLDGGNRKGHVVIKGTPVRLMQHLVEDHSTVDPTYVEDFIMTCRTFLRNSTELTSNLLKWFRNSSVRDRVTRVVLLWVNNHYNDFESDPAMVEFLEQFEDLLDKQSMTGQLRLLHIACAAKAKQRTLTLARSTRDSVLHFSVLGGRERGCGIFISKVEKGSKAQEVGLRRGDQILEVNGHNFERMSHAKALEILRGTTHLSITLKTNMLAFKEMLSTPENPDRRMSRELARLQSNPRGRLSIPDIAATLSVPPASPTIKGKEKDKKGFATLGHKARIRRAMAKLSILPNKNMHGSDSQLNRTQDDSNMPGKRTSVSSLPSSFLSNSNPDLTAPQNYESYNGRPDFPDSVIKVYKSDQTCKYFLVHKETTAREVVMLAMREFGLTDNQDYGKYSLCEVSVALESLVKQKRLPDHLNNLAERISLHGRYYLKNNMTTEQLVTDEIAVELLKEGQVSFLQLNSVEVAIHLTLRDFELFQAIEPTEYVEDLWKIRSKYGTQKLKEFEELVDQEMFWVVTEITSEPNIVKRMRIIKQFIKIARHCKDCKNFNSMFAILSGLSHCAVARLRTSWDKLPSKYSKMFADLQDFMDPSRNMSKYRNLVNSENVQPPVVNSIFPVVKKDLTFIHLGNDSVVEGLINFEKLRMIAKEVRYICRMGSSYFDPKNMFDHTSTVGGPSVAFAVLGAVAGPTVAAQRKKNYGRRNSTLPNPKKIWEEGQMVRKVREYIKNAQVIKDEKELMKLSVNCEGTATSDKPQPSSSNMSTASLRRNTLPNLTESTTSLTQTKPSSTVTQTKRMVFPDEPKTRFGATSPKHLRKLLALSEEGQKRMKSKGSLNIFRPSKSANTSPSSSPTNSPPEVRRHHLRRPPSLQRSHTDTSESGVGSAGSSIGSSDTHSADRIKAHIPGGSARSSYTSSYDTTSLDSAHSAASSYDSKSISSVGSASPPIRESRHHLLRARHLSPPPAFNHNKPVVANLPPRPLPHYHQQHHQSNKITPPTPPAGNPQTPPDYNTATASLANSPYKSQQSVQDRRPPKPPDYHVATAARSRKNIMHYVGGSTDDNNQPQDYLDEDGEQVSVVNSQHPVGLTCKNCK